MKRILTTTAMTLLLASAASASMSSARLEVRPYTMGGASVNMIMKSQSNIWLFPQYINQYPNQAEGVFDNGPNSSRTSRSSDDTFARFGAHYQFNEGSNPFVVGVYFDNAPAYNPFSGISNSQYFSATPAPFTENATSSGASLLNNHTLNAFYGRNLGGNPFGVNLYVANSNNEDSPNGSRVGLTSIGATVGMSVGGGAWDFALDFGKTTFTDERDVGGTITPYTEPDGNSYFGASARRWFPINSKITWVAHGMIHSKKIAWTNPNNTLPNGDGTVEIKDNNFDLGVGLNFTPTSKVLAILDVMFTYGKTTDERDSDGDGTFDTDMSSKTSSFPPFSFTAGMDAEVFSWLDLRMGASNYRSVTTFDDNVAPTTQHKQSMNNVGTFLGFGFHFGDLEVDASVDPRFVINGPDFVSGDDTRNMFMTVAATMHF